MLNTETPTYEEFPLPSNNENRNNIRYIFVIGATIILVLVIIIAKLLV